MKDWVGDANSIFKAHGASNHCDEERESRDYYATDPKALEMLLEREDFSRFVWEPACGEGHLSEVLRKNGYNVRNSDIIDRGYPNTEIIDFLKVRESGDEISRDIITNPPYKYAALFVDKALGISQEGTKVAMFLKLTFLEGQERRRLFDLRPPKRIYVFSKRINCAKNGDFTERPQSAVAYAWFIWVKGFRGNPEVLWL